MYPSVIRFLLDRYTAPKRAWRPSKIDEQSCHSHPEDEGGTSREHRGEKSKEHGETCMEHEGGISREQEGETCRDHGEGTCRKHEDKQIRDMKE